jgi:hypothetical protein
VRIFKSYTGDIRTYTDADDRSYVVRIRSYVRSYVFVCVSITALYRRYTDTYEQYTCTYGCVRIGFWVVV